MSVSQNENSQNNSQNNSNGNLFESRSQAGRRLGELLKQRLETSPSSSQSSSSQSAPTAVAAPLVIAFPSGGLPVAKAIADAIGADLDVAPASLSATPDAAQFAPVTADSWQKSTGPLSKGRVVILADDGVMTGGAATTLALRVREAGAVRIIVAVPIASRAALKRFDREGIECVSLHTADSYTSLDEFFGESDRVQDHEVESVRQAASRGLATKAAREASSRRLELDLGDFHTNAAIDAPSGAVGAVLLIDDGSATVRSLVGAVHDIELASFVCDLSGGANDVPAQARLVRRAIEHLSEEAETQGLPVAVIATGEFAAAALEAAASVPERVRCVISISGRPDRAQDFLARVMAPTLLLVNEKEEELVWKNRAALKEFSSEKTLVLVNSAEEMKKSVTAWLERFLKPARPERGSSAPGLSALPV